MDDLTHHHHGDPSAMSMDARADALEHELMHELEERVAVKSTLFHMGDGEIKVDTVIRFQDGTTQRIRTTLQVIDLMGGAMREAAE